MSLSPLMIEKAVRAALEEDMGHGHDITTDSLIPSGATGRAVLRTREDGVLAGLPVGLSAFTLLNPACEITSLKQDGNFLGAGENIAAIEGPARSILTAERVALNFISHLSGIATKTCRYVQAIEGTDAAISCTRKTLPGLRAFQKYAVRCGGGVNHRVGLDDAILIKDNHIALAGGISAALDRAFEHAGHTVKIEIEVDTLPQLEEVLAHGGADIVMLDNFTLEDMAEAVDIAEGALTLEASGGVTLDTVRGMAETGVDLISVGALTHSVKALDIGLDIDL